MRDFLLAQQNVRTWAPVHGIRWCRRPGRSFLGVATFERVLQQAWQCRETGEIDWRDVPMEYQP